MHYASDFKRACAFFADRYPVSNSPVLVAVVARMPCRRRRLRLKEEARVGLCRHGRRRRVYRVWVDGDGEAELGLVTAGGAVVVMVTVAAAVAVAVTTVGCTAMDLK